MSNKCPYCGGLWVQIEKDTSSGQDVREFRCESCGRTEIERRGPALWQVLSDGREWDEALRTLREPLTARWQRKDIDALLMARDAGLIEAVAELLESSDRAITLAALTILEQCGEPAREALTRFAREQARLILDRSTPPDRLDRAKFRIAYVNLEIRDPLLVGAFRAAALQREARGDISAFIDELMQIAGGSSFEDHILRGNFAWELDMLAKERGGAYTGTGERLRRAEAESLLPAKYRFKGVLGLISRLFRHSR